MYSQTVLDHFGNPRNAGTLDRYDARGVCGNPSAGPFMVVYLAVKEGGSLIDQIRYQTYGCVAAIAAGSILTEMAKGQSVERAASIDPADLRARMGPLPLGKEQCADLAVSALRAALRQFDPRISRGS